MHLAALIRDDQGPLELTHVLRVDAEVRLERLVHHDTGWHVDERSTRPHRGVERCELVVVRGDDRPEPLLDQLRVLPDRGVHVGEDHTHRLKIGAVAVEDDLRLVLRCHAGEVLALRLGDAELLVGVLDRVWQVCPLLDLLIRGLDVVVDVVEVEVRHVDGEPLGHRSTVESLQSRETKVPHPFGLLLDRRHLTDDRLVDPLLRLEDIVFGIRPAELVLAEIKITDGHESSSAGLRRSPGLALLR